VTPNYRTALRSRQPCRKWHTLQSVWGLIFAVEKTTQAEACAT